MTPFSKLQSLLPGSQILNCESPDSLLLQGLATLKESRTGYLTYVNDKSYLKDSLETKASALLIHKDWAEKVTIPCLLVEDVDLAFVILLNHFFPKEKPKGKRGQYVAIDPSATIGELCDIGNFVSIGKGSRIGKNCRIADGVKIGENVTIGDEASIGPNCVFFDSIQIGDRFVSFGNSTFGGDGFRFVDRKGIQIKIPQVGSLIIGDDVEVGSNSSIDRGGLEDTVIGSGTKMDNDVQIAHNVKVGKNVIIAGATAVAGSAIIEDQCKISGACAIADHITLPAGTMVAGGSGLRNSPEKADVFAGWDWNLTFREFQKFRANVKHILTLNLLVKRVSDLEKKQQS